MAFKIKKKRGRPTVDMKIRNLEAIAPANYEFMKSKGKMAYFKRKV